MNVENIIAAAHRSYKHCLISWNREVIIPASDIVPGASGHLKIMVCKTAGGPAVSYVLGRSEGNAFIYEWNAAKVAKRLPISRWTQKACEAAFSEAVKNAEIIGRDLIAAK